MVDLVEAIRKGIEARYEYIDPSFPDPISYRPITLWEHEMAHQNALSECYDREIIKLLVGVGDHDIELDQEQYRELRRYQFDIMLWICYYGLRDFQPEGFTIDTLKKLYINVKKLSILILKVSMGNREQVVEVIKNRDNVELAYIIHVLNIPLVSEAWKVTPLQVEYLINSKRHFENPQPDGVEVTSEMINENPMKYKEKIKEMFGVGRGSGRWHG